MEKNETLDEAAERHAKMAIYPSAQDDVEFGFRLGAKWQAERMYNLDEITEECIDNWLDYRIDNSSKISFKEWFKQFKKK